MAEFVPVDTFDLVIFGGTGDLARRKLLPALFHRDAVGQFSAGSWIVAVSRGPIDMRAYRLWVREALDGQLDVGEIDETVWQRFARRLSHHDLDTGDGWAALAVALDDDVPTRVFYLATAPGLFGPVAQRLGEHGQVAGGSRIVLEKPIGHDHDSAHAINDAVGAVFAESQI